jgi:hypothetical protein
MDANINQPHSHEPHPIGHETTDVNIWAIGKFAIGLVIITLLSVFLLIGLFKFFETRDGQEARTMDPVKSFPTPTLLPDEPKVLGSFKAGEDKQLSSYGWVDQSKGIVRIPVDQALEAVAKRGLPARQQGAQASAVSMPTESGLGIPNQGPSGEPPAAEQKSTNEGKSYPGEVKSQEGHEANKK